MLLTIHNLPSYMQYANVRSLIQSQCGIKADDVILDNLVNEGRSKKVTVGLVGEKQAEILKRKINGMLVGGQQLYVKDLGEQQSGNKNMNRSSGYQKNDSPSKPSQAHQSQVQQGYPTNLNQYQPNYRPGNQAMSKEQMFQMLNETRGVGGVGYMPLQNPDMDYSGQMQSAIAPQYSCNQQEQNVDFAKKDDRSASTTKKWRRDDYDDQNDRYQNKGDGDRRKYDRDDEYNNRYQVDHMSKSNDHAMKERSTSWGRDEQSRYHEESYQNHGSNQANRPWDTDRERLQRSQYQSGRDSRSRSRSPYYYEDRERAVSRDRYNDTGRPDSLYQRRDSAYTAVASTSRQYGGDGNNSQPFNYELAASECNKNPLSRFYRGDKGDQLSEGINPLPQSWSRWDKPDNPLPQSKGAQPQGDRWDKPNNQLPQGWGAQPQGDRWDNPNNQSPQGRGAQPQGDRWDNPNNQSPQGRGAQPQGDRWDKPNNQMPQGWGAQPQGDRWDNPNNQLPQGRSAQPQGDRWDNPNNQLPQGRGAQPQGDRWDKPNNQLPQGRGAQPQGDRWDNPNNQLPQGRGAQPQGNRWDKPNNQSPQGRGGQPQGDRWDNPKNQSPQGRGAQPQGDRWGKSSTSQPREPQRPASPKRNSPKPIIWEDLNPSSVKGNIQPLMQNSVQPPPETSKKMLHTPQPQNKRHRRKAQSGNLQPLMRKPVPSPPKQNTAPPKSFKSEEPLSTSLPKRVRNKRQPKFVTPNMKRELVRIYKTRNTAAAAIADDMCEALPPPALVHRKRVRNTIKKSVYVRMELILKNERVGYYEVIRRYREKFPTSTDRQILEVCYKKVVRKPLRLAPKTDPTSAYWSGAASTSVEETANTCTKVEPVKDEDSTKPNEPIVTVQVDADTITAPTAVKVEEEIPEDKDNLKPNETVATTVSEYSAVTITAPTAVKVEAETVPTIVSEFSADVTFDKEIKLQAPTKPAVPKIVGKLPKYPNGDKQTYKENKKLAAQEFKAPSGYTLSPALTAALQMELAPIQEIFRSELKHSNGGEATRVCEIIARKAVTFDKCLHLLVTKRLLDIRTNLILRAFVHGPTPHQSQVEGLLRQYGVISLNKTVKQGPLYYIAECDNYEGYDQLLEIGSFSLGPQTTLVIKPFHVAGPMPKPMRQKKGKGRGKNRR